MEGAGARFGFRFRGPHALHLGESLRSKEPAEPAPVASQPVSGTLLAIGVDGARGGWLAAVCFGDADGKVAGRRTEVKLCRSFTDLIELRGEAQVPVAVDIPMGLMEGVDFRPCDEQARELLGARRVTVFAPPSRPLLTAATYAEARGRIGELRKTNPEAKGLSAQAFAIAPKIKEVDDWLQGRAGAQGWLFECHPELSFRAMAEGRVLDGKNTAHGQVDRLRLATSEFPDALDAVSKTSFAAKDVRLADVLDAYAALDSALHVAARDYEELGGEPDELGLVMRMVY
jgi:predicted RNase H-like nuclease